VPYAQRLTSMIVEAPPYSPWLSTNEGEMARSDNTTSEASWKLYCTRGRTN
jgi:transposase